MPAGVNKNTPRTPGSAVIGAEYMDQIVAYPGIIANVASAESKAAGVGATHTLPEIDGVNRRIPLVVTVDGKIYPALSMEVLRVAAMCKKLKGNFGGQMDKYYKIWIERCDFMKQQNLPDIWNGEFIAHEK